MDASWKEALAEALAAARTQLGETARDLEAIQFRLRGVEASLPPAPIELVELFEVDFGEEMDARTELRATIQHVVTALIEPAVRELRAAAAPPEDGFTARPP